MLSKEFLITFFNQGKVDNGGNCAIIALLKSAIGTWENNVVKLEETNTGYAVILKNGADEEITFDQITIAKRNSRFILQNSVGLAKEYFDYVHILYTIMGKINMKDRRYSSLEHALYRLNLGENTEYIAHRLRLGAYYSNELKRGFSTEEEFVHLLNTKENFILYSKGHTVYASEGYYDDYGRIKKLRNQNTILNTLYTR